MHRKENPKKNKGKNKDKQKQPTVIENTTKIINTDPMESMERAYHNARITFIKLFTQLIWRQHTPSYQQNLTILEQVTNKLIDTGQEGTILLRTLLKLNILLWRIHLLSKNETKTQESFKTIMTILRATSEIKLFGLKDFYLHDEVSYFLCSAAQILRNAKLEHSESYFHLVEFGYNYSLRWQPSILKLPLLFNYWLTAVGHATPLIDRISLSEKRTFIETYQESLNDIEKTLAEYPTDAECAIGHAKANLMMYIFERNTNPLLKTDKLKNPVEASKHIKCLHETITKYLASSIKLLLVADPADLQADALAVTDLISFIGEARSTIQSNIELFAKLRKETIPTELNHYLLKAELELVNLKADTHEIYNSFQLNEIVSDTDQNDQIKINDADIKAMREIAKEELTRLTEEKNKQRMDLAMAANDNARSFGWHEREQQQFSGVIDRLKKRSQSSAQLATTTSSNKTVSSPLHYLTRAQYFARNRRTQDAVEVYENVYQVAINTNDSYLQLSALEGKILAYAKTILHKAKILHVTLSARTIHLKTLPKVQLAEFSKFADEIEHGQQELTKLLALYRTMAKNPALKTNQEFVEGVAFSQADIEEMLLDINNKIAKTHELFSSLNETLIARQKNYVYGLGLETVNKIKHTLFSKDEIMVIGWEIFKEIGRKKQLEGKGISNETHEKRAIESITKQFDRVKNNLGTLAQSIDNTSEVGHFGSVKDICCEKLLVGSCAIQDDDANLITHDIDFVIAQKDETLLIKCGFHHSIYLPNLYQRPIPEKTDIALIKDLSDAALLEDAKSRDFTVCAVYQRKDGTRIDPLGTGIDDATNRRLRMIGNPTKRLHEDPTRALRAIRYMLSGYTPDNSLSDALKNMWLPDEQHRQHLNAVAKKHLQSPNRHQYVKMLYEFGLLEKLFGIPLKSNIDTALWKLEKLLNVQKPKIINHTQMFAHTDDFPALKKEEDKNINYRPNIKGLTLA